MSNDPRLFWHGGRHIDGDIVTAHPDARSGDPDGWVYVARDRGLALTYAATCDGWLYRVRPVDAPEQDPGSSLPLGESMRCRRARIVARFRPVEEYGPAEEAVKAVAAGAS